MMSWISFKGLVSQIGEFCTAFVHMVDRIRGFSNMRKSCDLPIDFYIKSLLQTNDFLTIEVLLYRKQISNIFVCKT
jgi:hypothetical protein